MEMVINHSKNSWASDLHMSTTGHHLKPADDLEDSVSHFLSFIYFYFSFSSLIPGHVLTAHTVTQTILFPTNDYGTNE